MKSKKIILCITILFGAIAAYPNNLAEQIFKKAQKEAKRDLNDGIIARLSKSLVLFEEAANLGSAEAAYTIFCYKCFGWYNDWNFHFMEPERVYDRDSWNNLFDEGIKYLKLAHELEHPDLKDYILLVNDPEYEKRENLYNDLYKIFQAKKGDANAQMSCAYIFKHKNNNERYLYWLKQSVNNKNWPILARMEYAFYLLDNGLREEAIEIVKPADRKQDYRKDDTTWLGFNLLRLFHVAEALYADNINSAINNCDVFYDSDNWASNNHDFERLHKKHDVDYLEYCIDFYTTKDKSRKWLFDAIYKLNNTQDSLLLYNRGNTYRAYNDSTTAFNFYKKSALSGYIPAIKESINYIVDGYGISDDDLYKLLPFIIMDENKDNVFIHRDLIDWTTYYVLGKFYYNSSYKDYRKALGFFNMCFSDNSCPKYARRESALYISECLTNGWGVEANQQEAEQWRDFAKKLRH